MLREIIELDHTPTFVKLSMFSSHISETVILGLPHLPLCPSCMTLFFTLRIEFLDTIANAITGQEFFAYKYYNIFNNTSFSNVESWLRKSPPFVRLSIRPGSWRHFTIYCLSGLGKATLVNILPNSPVFKWSKSMWPCMCHFISLCFSIPVSKEKNLEYLY